MRYLNKKNMNKNNKLLNIITLNNNKIIIQIHTNNLMIKMKLYQIQIFNLNKMKKNLLIYNLRNVNKKTRIINNFNNKIKMII